MKIKNLKRIITFTCLCGMILLAGCQLQTATQTVEATEAPTVQQDGETPVVTENMYPSSPEEVIRAFLQTYPVDSVNAVQYLSPSLVKDLDVDSVAKLLPGSGDINGFIIESGSSSAEDEKSEILASIAFADVSTEVLFNLEIDDGRWVISKISEK